MKAKAPKSHSSISHAHSSTPFFNKFGKGSFFSNTKETEGAFFSPSFIQPKLTIGQPGDKYEQEADAMADKVMSMPTVQTKCADCKKEEGLQTKLDLQRQEEIEEPLQTKLNIQKREDLEEESLQTKPVSSKAFKSDSVTSPNLTSKLNQNKGNGSSLSDTTNTYMSNAFGTDFSSVNIHTGNDAVQMNEELGAKAFTHGADIYFNKGEFSPNSTSGKKLLAHELTHVVQQGASSSKQNHIQQKVEGNMIQRAVTETKQESHAGLFELSTHTPLGGPTFAPQAQYDVKIEFSPYQVINCEEIDFIQTVRNVINGTVSGSSGLPLSRALTAAEGTEGVGIDQLPGNPNPYYTRDAANAVEAGMQSGRRTGKGASNITRKAFMTDTPGFPGTGGANRTAGDTLLQDFEACAVCKKGNDKDVYFGCVSWGYDIDASNKFTEHPFKLVSKGTPSSDFLAAGKKWNAQTAPAGLVNMPIPTHLTDQTSLTVPQLKAKIKALETKLKGLLAGNADIPQVTFEIKLYKDILGAITYNQKRGYSSLDIKAIQAVIGITPNGKFDFDTIAKIKRWQVEQSLRGDGRFGPKSKGKFDSIVKSAVVVNKGKGHTKDQVKKIQRKVGSNDDGNWGPITVEHLMIWQKNNGLKPSGEFTLFTRFKMFGFFGF